jgi:RNA polymerase sigma-70 factor (ECF subfamily)
MGRVNRASDQREPAPVDAHLLERLVTEHGPALELFAAQWTDAPEDSVQEALLQLVRQAKPPERVVPWLYRVVRNLSVSAARRKSRQRRHEAAVAGIRPRWFQPDAGGEIDTGVLTAALASLVGQHREVIVARIWGGLTFEQIAEVIGASSSSAHRRYVEGLEQLRIAIGVPCPNETNRKWIASS